MKSTAIKPYPAWATWRNVFLVKIETDEGIYGWGEGRLPALLQDRSLDPLHAAIGLWAASMDENLPGAKSPDGLSELL